MPDDTADGRSMLLAWLDGGPPPERSVLRAAVKESLSALARAAPGRSVEVRVPPFAAVQCIAGLQHGRGTFYFAAGEKYEGDWRDGKPNGRGVKTYADGRRYDGEWKDNTKHGRGRLTWADGASYDGDWVSDSYHGHGVLRSAEATYEGAFRAHKFHGQGTKTFADGRKLQGDWKNGEPNFHESARQMPPGLSPEAMDMMEQMRTNEKARVARGDL